MRFRLLTSALILITVFVSQSSFHTDIRPSVVEDVLSQTNKFRRSRGLPVLIINPELNAIARRHSMNMAGGRVGFGHSGFSKRYQLARRSVRGVNRFAENVAFGAATGSEAVKGWRNSPGHRRNMLGQYKYIGIGVAKDRRGRLYYTQVFAG